MQSVLIGLGATLVVYPLLALALIWSQSLEGNTEETAATERTIDFGEAIGADYAGYPDPLEFAARDGARLPFRLYPAVAGSEQIIVLVHGSGWHGMQFHAMAKQLAGANAGTVAVPDLRGHGFHPQRRGDIDHAAQFEDDLADLIGHMRTLLPDSGPVVMAGHSSGGGLVVRFAGGGHGGAVDAYVLLAPFLKYNAPTTRPNSGGWAQPATRRIIGLSMLNAIGIMALDHLPVIRFNMPREVLDGPFGSSATTEYSHRLNTGFAPRSDYTADLAAIRVPLLVLAGENDEAFHAGQYEPVIRPHVPGADIRVLPGLTHIGLVTSPVTASALGAWVSATLPE